MATAWPDLLAYKIWARVPDDVDDPAIEAALAAVLAAIAARCPCLFGPTPVVPDDAYQAALLWTNRTMARRNSPEGIVGSELGAVSVGRFDPDVSRLLSPYVTPVLA
jgi:hypothetical protein